MTSHKSWNPKHHGKSSTKAGGLCFPSNSLFWFLQLQLNAYHIGVGIYVVKFDKKLVLVRHLRKLTCKHFRPPHLLSLLILLFFTLCNMCHKQFFYRHHQSPFVTFKNANKSRGILHTSFFLCFQKKCWHPVDRKPLVWKIPQKHCIPKKQLKWPQIHCLYTYKEFKSTYSCM